MLRSSGKNKSSDKNIEASLARQEGLCPGAAAPIASRCSLPRRQKQSTGLFFFVTSFLPPCSSPSWEKEFG